MKRAAKSSAKKPGAKRLPPKKPDLRLLDRLLPGIARKFRVQARVLRVKLQTVLRSPRLRWRYARVKLTPDVRSAFAADGVGWLPDTAVVLLSETHPRSGKRNLLAFLPDAYRGAEGTDQQTVRVLSITKERVPALFWDVM